MRIKLSAAQIQSCTKAEQRELFVGIVEFKNFAYGIKSFVILILLDIEVMQ